MRAAAHLQLRPLHHRARGVQLRGVNVRAVVSPVPELRGVDTRGGGLARAARLVARVAFATDLVCRRAVAAIVRGDLWQLGTRGGARAARSGCNSQCGRRATGSHIDGVDLAHEPLRTDHLLAAHTVRGGRQVGHGGARVGGQHDGHVIQAVVGGGVHQEAAAEAVEGRRVVQGEVLGALLYILTSLRQVTVVLSPTADFATTETCIWIHSRQVQTLLVARSAGTVQALGAEVGAAVGLLGDVLVPAPTDALLRPSLLGISAS